MCPNLQPDDAEFLALVNPMSHGEYVVIRTEQGCSGELEMWSRERRSARPAMLSDKRSF